MVEFCKSFNAATEHLKEDTPTPVKVSCYTDRSFAFKVKTPHTSWLLKQCAGIEKGTSLPGQETVGEISLKHVFEIAKVKHTDEAVREAISLKGLVRSIVGQAASLGIKVHGKGY